MRRLLSSPSHLLLMICLAWGSSLSAADKRPCVLVIGIDGTRPDALAIAKTPHLDALAAAGMYFEGTDIREPEATDKADTISGPGWSNLLTGVWPDKHNVLDNKFSKPNYDRYPHFFVRLKETRPQAVAASFCTWKPIASEIVRGADLSKDFSNAEHDYARADADAKTACVKYVGEANPDVIVFYQGQVDEAGHAHGFHPTVQKYVEAIQRVDTNVGEVLQAIRSRPTFAQEDWLTIVCTDHGGRGTGHGGGHKEPDIRTTFLIVSGPSANEGRSDSPTWQVDVVPTALKHLGVELNAEWELDGKAVGLK